MKLCLFFTVAALLALSAPDTASSVQHLAPAPAVDCSSLILNLADCLAYVSNGSTSTLPEKTCCSGLKTVLSTDPNCLCEGLKSSAQLGIVLNVTKALTLPAACNLPSPSLASCGLSLGPSAPSPAVSPSSIAGGNEQAPAPAPVNSGSFLTMSTGNILAVFCALLVKDMFWV